MLAATLSLTACGTDAITAKFTNDMNTFCENISSLDTYINSINASSDGEAREQSHQELLSYLDQLEDEFKRLDNIDFPEEFDYLEELAEQSSNYMTEAVTYYHKLYESDFTDNLDSYNEIEAYARENYTRAYKRVQVILSLLHGEEPTGSDLKIEE